MHSAIETVGPCLWNAQFHAAEKGHPLPVRLWTGSIRPFHRLPESLSRARRTVFSFCLKVCLKVIDTLRAVPEDVPATGVTML